VIGQQAQAAGDVQLEADAGDVKAGVDQAGELLGVELRALRGAARHDHQELRLAEARHGVALGDVLAQPVRHLAQHVVADRHAERDVDVAQVPQGEQDQRATRARGGLAHQALEHLGGEPAVRQLRERVVLRVEGDGRLTLGDVALHGVEGPGEATELVAAGDVDRGLVLSLLDALRGARQLTDGACGGAAEHRAHQPRHEERDAVDRQHRIAQLAVGREHLALRLQEPHVD